MGFLDWHLAHVCKKEKASWHILGVREKKIERKEDKDKGRDRHNFVPVKAEMEAKYGDPDSRPSSIHSHP